MPRPVELVLPQLHELPIELVGLVLVYVLAPLLAGLAIAGALLVLARKPRPELARVEPQVDAAPKDPVLATYNAAKDWYGVSGDPLAEMIYLALEKRTGRHG